MSPEHQQDEDYGGADEAGDGYVDVDVDVDDSGMMLMMMLVMMMMMMMK